MNAIDLLDASDEVKAALRRRRAPTISLKQKPRPVTFTSQQRDVLRKMLTVKSGWATFQDMPLRVGDGVLKGLVARGMINVQITLTCTGKVQAAMLTQDEKCR